MAVRIASAGAHLLCDCTAIAEQEQQERAEHMHDFLLDPHDAAYEWHRLGLQAIPVS